MRNSKPHLSFSKRESLFVKGVLIILMVIHHLFSNELSPELTGSRFWWSVGDYGKICVSAYAFVSGYGLYVSMPGQTGTSVKAVVPRILKLLVRYWICLSLILLIDMICGNFVFSCASFLKVSLCYLGVFYSFDANAWFLLPYVCFVVLFPLADRWIARCESKIYRSILELSAILLPFGAAILSFMLVGEIGYVYNTLMYTVLFILPFFGVGALFAKHDFITRIRCFDAPIWNLFLGAFLLAISFSLRKIWVIWIYGMNAADLLNAPLLITALLFIVKGIKEDRISNVFIKAGKMSTNIWLIHYVFCQGSLLFVITGFKYAFLAFFIAALLCVAASQVIDHIYALLRRKFKVL